MEVAYATAPVRLGAATAREVWKRRHRRTLRFCSSWPTLTDAGAKCMKGDKGPEAWRPPNRGYWCEYARRWVWIKSDWHLAVNPAEKSSLRGMLGTCGSG